MARSDPRFINAKFAGYCARCGARIMRGDRVAYFPLTHTIIGGACGHADAAMRQFEAEAADEAMMAPNFGEGEV